MSIKALRPLAANASKFSHQRSTLSQLESSRVTSTTPTNHDRHTKHRTFFSPSAFNLNPLQPPLQRLTAHRTITHPPSIVYQVISDVSAYSSFLPFCQASTVTKHSSPASDGNVYPEEAKLVIGFNDAIAESFTSRVYCVPGRVVEAISGASETSLSAADIPHHSPRPPKDTDASRHATVMTQLRTRWTLKTTAEAGSGGEKLRTDVDLVIEFQFANPLYAAMSSAAAPKVADKMIEAFEKRVEKVVQVKAMKDVR